MTWILLDNLLNNMWLLSCEMAPYLLLGFLMAGLLHGYVPAQTVPRLLAKNDFRSVLTAALFGCPLPLCSCGVIPTAMGLRREGASRGATVSFLIATPQTGVDSIAATYSLMGLPFALVRPIAAFATALLGGWLANIKAPQTTLADHRAAPRTTTKGMRSALTYGFFTLVQDIGPWLIIGLLVAGLITTLVPEDWFTLFQNHPLAEMFLVLALGTPMYLCATGSIPIAVALMMKGLSPGAALVLLMAGPATNAASILVIRKVMGTPTLLVYLSALTLGAIAFGLGIDALPRQWFTSSLIARHACCTSAAPSWFSVVSVVLLAVLLVVALTPRLIRHKKASATIYIKGMHCTHCAEAVEKALCDVEGVKRATVRLGEKNATLEGKYDMDEVRRAVESIGFQITEKE